MSREISIELEEIDCPRGLFLDILGVGLGDAYNFAERMYECSVRLTENHFDRGERYAFFA